MSSSRCAATPAGTAQLEVTRLGDVVVKVDVDDLVGPDGRGCHVSVGPLAAGGYALRLAGAGWSARTAVAVVADPRSRLRYGFVANYRPGRVVADVADHVRRLHLTAVQFYDWAYRHADLVGGGDEYADALDQPVSLDTVRRLVDDVQAAAGERRSATQLSTVSATTSGRHGSTTRCSTATGQPYQLGDFLRLVDPAAPDWSAHFADDLAAAVETAGFDGFHLDQYGYPRFAAPRRRRLRRPRRRLRHHDLGRARSAARRATSCSTTSTTSRRGPRRTAARTPCTSRCGNRT